MSVLADVLDRLSGVAEVKARVTDLAVHLAEMRRIILDQQKELAEVRGQLKALIQMQSRQ